MKHLNPPHYIYIYNTAMNQLILINSYLISKTLKKEVIVFLKGKMEPKQQWKSTLVSIRQGKKKF